MSLYDRVWLQAHYNDTIVRRVIRRVLGANGHEWPSVRDDLRRLMRGKP